MANAKTKYYQPVAHFTKGAVIPFHVELRNVTDCPAFEVGTAVPVRFPGSDISETSADDCYKRWLQSQGEELRGVCVTADVYEWDKASEVRKQLMAGYDILGAGITNRGGRLAKAIRMRQHPASDFALNDYVE